MTRLSNPSFTKKIGKETVKDISFIILMLLAVLFSLWKCKYGFGGNDEPFYMTIPHRLTLGDALFKDEWNLSQLSSFLIYPFTWLYTLIKGSTTGILLASRYAYVVFHLAVSVIIYIKLRKFGFSSVIASVLYFMFTPYDIMALSYNTMGLDFIALTGVLLGTADYNKKRTLIFSGITFAGAVLCQPYVLIAYAVFILCVLANVVIKKLNKNNFFTGDYFAPKTFLWFTVGAVILAVLFFGFLLTRTSITDIINNLPYMFNDPQHPHIPLTTQLSYYFTTMWNCAELFNISIIAFCILMVVIIADKKRFNHRCVYLSIASLIVIFAYYTLFKLLVPINYNYIMFPIIYLGIASYVLTENKLKNLFACLFMLSVIFSFACCIASNQYFYIICCALVASNIASIIFIGNVIKEMVVKKADDSNNHILLMSYDKGETTKSFFISPKKLVSIVSALIMFFVIISQGYLQIVVKSNHVFWDQKPKYLTVTLTGGPAHGIVTTQANADVYHTTLQDIQKYYGNFENENLLCLTEQTWTYLAANDMKYGTYSAWITGGASIAVSRLNQYYSINPDKIPKYVYIPASANIDPSLVTATYWGSKYAISKTDYGYMLYYK